MLRKTMESPLREAADAEVWFGELAEIGRRYDFDYTIFTLLARDGLPISNAFYMSNFSVVWRKIYEQKRYAQIDPILQYCRSQLSLLIWDEKSFVGAEERTLYEQASGYGLRWGVACPIHGPKHEVGMLCFASRVKSDEARRNVESRLPELGLIRDMAYETSLQHVKQKTNAVVPKLTPRELECLKWMAKGKSSWEISRILSCSQSTVEYFVGNIRNKMGVHKRGQAVMMAVAWGLLDPQEPSAIASTEIRSA
ncbi:MAG TPA: LuxR family transcriptional regulator [Trinickia sp.]|jgi:LuxR family quorum-sensing transcriptional regulator LasR|uniref:helix-turn-helix transcriptional regulator n=1 Tax=Trinickia sp. TaxID=2571163 RepID=UPI002BC584B3|nr:LuxR family transcriptional regulator [Trinickia sp.]HTI16499.1 LuxR family transcriptional regulator [Trinickia sp.]